MWQIVIYRQMGAFCRGLGLRPWGGAVTALEKNGAIGPARFYDTPVLAPA